MNGMMPFSSQLNWGMAPQAPAPPPMGPPSFRPPMVPKMGMQGGGGFSMPGPMLPPMGAGPNGMATHGGAFPRPGGGMGGVSVPGVGFMPVGGGAPAPFPSNPGFGGKPFPPGLMGQQMQGPYQRPPMPMRPPMAGPMTPPMAPPGFGLPMYANGTEAAARIAARQTARRAARQTERRAARANERRGL